MANEAEQTSTGGQPPGAAPDRRLLLVALLIPLAAFAVQWTFWTAIRPYVWFLFFPAIFFSPWIGGLAGGLLATALSTAIVWFFFIPPQFAWVKETPTHLYSVTVFVLMGTLFSLLHERVKRAKRETATALAAARAANEQLLAANARITDLYEKTRELDELKSRFFANISHELRTPLALILAPAARWLAADDLPAAARRDLVLIERNARLLYRHVSDLLDAARLEAGRMTIAYVRADAANLARLMASHFDGLAEEKGMRFATEIPAALTAEIDVEKLQRILLNLLSNAFKFTPDGGAITLRLHAADGSIVIEVADNGPGVPAKLRQAVFERFRQGSGGTARSFGGTGLGLAIVKEFAELHGGSAAIGEAPGGGALLRVVLPQRAPPGAPILAAGVELDEQVDRQAVEELRRHDDDVIDAAGTPADAALVLVVDDNRDMNAYVAAALRSHYRVASAFDGEEGLEKALALQPDLILSDIMMPRLAGDRMVAALRRRPQMQDVPILVLTAKADDELRVKLLQDGVQDYLGKPFSTDELLARVGALLAVRRRSVEQLRRSEERYRLLVEQAADGIFVAGVAGRYVDVNSAGCQMLGYPREEILGLSMGDVIAAEEAPRLGTEMSRFAGGGVARSDWHMRRKDGSLFYGEVLGRQLPDGRIQTILRDVIERVESENLIRGLNADLERRVEARTAELRAANRELDSFAYAVSHDLRTPLRALSGLTGALHEDYGERLDDEARDYLDEIGRASRRMADLVDGLLVLSRTVRGEMRRDRVDLTGLAREVLAELGRSDPERRVDGQVEPDLTAAGDARMIDAVLRNLIGNAWKYTAGRERAEIRVFAGSRQGQRIYCVADNGAGFDMAHAARLFQPFQRLHRQDEFPGIGIGLATVQRIVHRHGGEVWGEGRPGQGATFSFSLPAQGEAS